MFLFLPASSGSNAQVSEGEDNENEMVVKGRNRDAINEDKISQSVCSDPGANACSMSSFNLF